MQVRSDIIVSGDSGGRFLGVTSDRSDSCFDRRTIEASEFDLSLPVDVSDSPVMLQLVLHMEFRVEMDLDSWFSKSHFSC